MVTRPGASVPGQPLKRVARGDVWLAVLDPTIGSEIRKTRPCVVVSPPEMHDHLRTVLAAPMITSGRPAPFRIPVLFEQRRGLILLDQIRALDSNALSCGWAWWRAVLSGRRWYGYRTCSPSGCSAALLARRVALHGRPAAQAREARLISGTDAVR